MERDVAAKPLGPGFTSGWLAVARDPLAMNWIA